MSFNTRGNEMKKILFVVLFALLISGCGEKFPVVDDFGSHHYALVNQNNKPLMFPDFVKGSIVVMNYIYTNCPDICPLSTNNMRLIQERLKKDNIKNVRFVSLSFDPIHDTPGELTKFAEVRNLDLSNWDFLTGDKKVTDALIKQAGVFAMPSDSTVLKNGKTVVNFVHTDRISLIDTEGKIRKNYIGSKINIDEITGDIKSLQ